MMDEDHLEQLSNSIRDLYDRKYTMERSCNAADRALLEATGFKEAGYLETTVENFSSGWRYKCQPAASLVAKPNLIDEPSFLDQKAIEWFIEELKSVTKSSNSMVFLVSHKKMIMESLADRILHINSASKILSLLNCSYAIFQTTHSDQQNHARKTLEHSKNERHRAQISLEHVKKDLRKRETNMKNATNQNADKRFIKGKAIENMQKLTSLLLRNSNV
jgi:ATPase subunit of ABC transporter with duplicated ATPase domains